MKSLPLWILAGLVLLFAGCGRKEAKANLVSPADQAVQVNLNNTTVQNSYMTTAAAVQETPDRVSLRESAPTKVNATVTAGTATGGSTLNITETSTGNVTGSQPSPVVAGAASPVVLPSDVRAWTRLSARSGSKVRIEGTSTVHDWQVESPLIGGYVDVGPGFPLFAGQTMATGGIPVRGDAFVTARSLKSVQKDGRPYSDKMDEIMYEKLLADKYPRLTFKVMGLTAGPDGATPSPAQYLVTGELSVAGVTKNVQVPVTIEATGGGKVSISGQFTAKMTDFSIKPPEPVGYVLKTADEVKVIFHWIVAPRQPVAAK